MEMPSRMAMHWFSHVFKSDDPIHNPGILSLLLWTSALPTVFLSSFFSQLKVFIKATHVHDFKIVQYVL